MNFNYGNGKITTPYNLLTDWFTESDRKGISPQCKVVARTEKSDGSWTDPQCVQTVDVADPSELYAMMPDLLSFDQWAREHNVDVQKTQARFGALARTGRMPGVVMAFGSWLVHRSQEPTAELLHPTRSRRTDGRRRYFVYALPEEWESIKVQGELEGMPEDAFIDPNNKAKKEQ